LQLLDLAGSDSQGANTLAYYGTDLMEQRTLKM
jgi:hypothetical protein